MSPDSNEPLLTDFEAGYLYVITDMTVHKAYGPGTNRFTLRTLDGVIAWCYADWNEDEQHEYHGRMAFVGGTDDGGPKVYAEGAGFEGIVTGWKLLMAP